MPNEILVMRKLADDRVDDGDFGRSDGGLRAWNG